MIESHQEFEKMAAVEERLWWYRNLHALVLDTISRCFGMDAAILDAGCGSGGLLLKLRNAGYSNLTAFDLSNIAVEFTQKRGFEVSQHNLKDASRVFPASAFDVVISNDTLYYFTLDELPEVITGLAKLLKPRGLLITNLPALDSFSGIHDRAVGIVHRFRKKDIASLAQMSGLEQYAFRFWPFFLSPAIFAARLFQRLKLRSGVARIESDVNPLPRLLDESFYAVTRLEYCFSDRYPWGSSGFVVLRKG
jgi:SAM-dependent methyltransferase